jgi:sugar phosphate isomerase/epimerase
VKDLAPAGTEAEEGWADFGHGTLPWADWLARLASLSPAFLALEHDAPADPARFVTRSAAAFHKLVGVAA